MRQSRLVQNEEDALQRAQKVMVALVKSMKTQLAVALALGVSKQRFNNWYCKRVKKVPLEAVEAMEALWKEQQGAASSEDCFAKASLYQLLSCYRDAIHCAQEKSQMPLYLLYFELGDSCCDARGWFPWDSTVLGAKLMLSRCMNLDKGLDALCQCGAIERMQQGGVLYGRMREVAESS